MSYLEALQHLPEEQRWPLVQFADAIKKDLHAELGVRRQDIDDLRAVVSELAEAQQRTEQRVEELAEAQQRTESRLERLEGIVAELAEAQMQTQLLMGELVEAQKKTEQHIGELIEGQKRNSDSLSQLRGHVLELRYRDRAATYFGRWLRPVELICLNTLREELETLLHEDDVEEIMNLDLLIHGRARRVADQPEVWLAVEVSGVIDRNDVERAQRRAGLLRRAGYRAIPAVAGEGVTGGAEHAISLEPTVVIRDGRSEGWEAALA